MGIRSFIKSLGGSKPSKKKASNADAMRELRVMMLKTPPAEMGFQPSEEFPHVFAVLMDWPVELAIATVRGDCSGGASLYTTGTFGIIGGEGHERVRQAAKSFVRVGERFCERAVATTDFNYPNKENIRFYLVCFDGVRIIETNAANLAAKGGEFLDLYIEGQKLLAELRMVSPLKA